MLSQNLLILIYLPVIFAQSVHLSCGPTPDSQCDVGKYCTYTANNFDCASTTWNSQDNIPTFTVCEIDTTCGDGHVCHNGLCCNTAELPNGEADCPDVGTIEDCCFQYMPQTLGYGVYQPPEMDRPAELSCGC